MEGEEKKGGGLVVILEKIERRTFIREKLMVEGGPGFSPCLVQDLPLNFFQTLGSSSSPLPLFFFLEDDRRFCSRE